RAPRAAGARAVRPGAERARRVRRRRRPARLDEAGRVGRRRGRDVDLPRAPLPGHDLMRLDDLRPLGIFDGLTDEQLAELVEGGTEVPVEPGVDLFREGEHADFWWVLIDGAIDLVRHVGPADTRVAREDV